MSCCRAGPCEQMFKPRLARRSLARYRSRGLDSLEQRMLASAAEEGVNGIRVLEIGGGIGMLQAELLAAGAREGEVIELVPAWEPYAAELAREHGLEDRTTFRVVDVLEEPETVARADVVVMNRVVCCTPDGIELARLAAHLAGRRLVLSFPRDVFWLRAGIRVMNATFRLMGRSFRVFVHPRASLVDAAGSEGLELRGEGRTVAWEYMALGRA